MLIITTMCDVPGAVLAPPILGIGPLGQWGPEVSEGGPVIEKIVGHMFIYAVFDVKPTHNH